MPKRTVLSAQMAERKTALKRNKLNASIRKNPSLMTGPGSKPKPQSVNPFEGGVLSPLNPLDWFKDNKKKR